MAEGHTLFDNIYNQPLLVFFSKVFQNICCCCTCTIASYLAGDMHNTKQPGNAVPSDAATQHLQNCLDLPPKTAWDMRHSSREYQEQ